MNNSLISQNSDKSYHSCHEYKERDHHDVATCVETEDNTTNNNEYGLEEDLQDNEFPNVARFQYLHRHSITSENSETHLNNPVEERKSNDINRKNNPPLHGFKWFRHKIEDIVESTRFHLIVLSLIILDMYVNLYSF